jgi:hypothetical protein
MFANVRVRLKCLPREPPAEVVKHGDQKSWPIAKAVGPGHEPGEQEAKAAIDQTHSDECSHVGPRCFEEFTRLLYCRFDYRL